MSTTCPNSSTWQSLLSGGLAESEVARLEAHLESCSDCHRLLDDLSGCRTTSFAFAEHESIELESSELSRAVARLKGRSTTDHAQADWDISSHLKPGSRPDALGSFGGYEILQVIAHGGMGIVLKAHDPALDRIVAIKVLAPALAADAGFRERFVREARAAAVLQHDHIVVIHSVGEEDGLPFIVMQHLAGPSLQQHLEANGPLAKNDLIRVGAQIASALQTAHGAGLVHRDIKPANILMEDGLARVRVTDFGLVYSVERPMDSERRLIAGTPQFMSPEQASGGTITTASDMFSLGATLYNLATGRPPFQASSITELLERVRSGTPPPIEQLRPDLPEAIRALIQRLMSRDAGLRPEASEVHEALAAMDRPRAKTALVWGALAASILLLLAAIGVVRFGPGGANDLATVRFRIESDGAMFGSLPECVAAARPNDTIEISGTGSVEVASVRIVGKPLRFRAALGASPVLIGTNNLLPIFESDSPLVLEGLTLERSISELKVPPLIRVTNSFLRLAYCRLMKNAFVARMIDDRVFFIEADDAPLVELAHCEVISLERAAGTLFSRFTKDSLPGQPGAGAIRIGHSLLTGLQAVEVENSQTEPVLLRLVQSVFMNRTLLRLDEIPPSNSLQVRADHCVFDLEALVSGFAWARDHFRRQLVWAGEDNHYSVKVAFAAEPRNARSVPALAYPLSFEKWMMLESVSETDSRSARLDLWKEIRNVGIQLDSLQASQVVLPAAVSMTIPPDLRLIGPGIPYETWRNSEDYAAWERAIEVGDGR